jgi:transcriptional regulator with XRE-family HTH domain
MTRGVRLRDPDALRAYVRLMGLSERALAARAGVSHATLNHLLSGRRTTCRRSTARAIESVLACPVGVFFRSSPATSSSSHRPDEHQIRADDGVVSRGTNSVAARAVRGSARRPEHDTPRG